MKILLVVCPYGIRDNKFKGLWREFLGVQYICAVLREAGHDVTIMDPGMHRMTYDEFIKTVKRGNYEMIGFSINERAAHLASEMLMKLRENGIDAHFVAGGHYPTLSHERVLNETPALDSIVRGEGELTIKELADRLSSGEDWRDIQGIAYKEDGKIKLNPGRPLIDDIDTIPFPTREFLPLHIVHKGYRCYMITSRGCYGNCSYCSMNVFYAQHPNPKKWRARSAKNVVDEMELLVKKYGVKYVGIDDDNFMGPGSKGKQRAREIADEILKRNLEIKYIFACRPNDVEYELFAHLKKSGAFGVFLGIDSMNQRSLDMFNRKLTVEQNLRAIEILDDLKMKPEYGFINYDPLTKLDELKNNYEFIKSRMDKHRSYTFVYFLAKGLEIYDSTSLVDYSIERNLLDKDENGDYIKDEFGYVYTIGDERAEQVRQLSFRMKSTILDCLSDFSKKSKQLLDRVEEEKSKKYVQDRVKEMQDDLHFLMLHEYGDLLKREEEHGVMSKEEEDKFIENFRESIIKTYEKFLAKFDPMDIEESEKLEIGREDHVPNIPMETM
ncbi:radical SAM protein [candidate division KSB1 bacterium]|nr:radical SAM protein [candidate division KSB1 bacterium]